MAITTIITRQIRDLAITTGKLVANAVTLAKLGALSAKGDLLVHDGTDHQKLGAGTNTFVLTADSTASNGVKWAAASVLPGSFVFGETPTGTVNGTNDTFTLANTPVSGTERVYVNGVRMKSAAGNDYTISTTSITFLTGAVPQTGDVIQVDYMK